MVRYLIRLSILLPIMAAVGGCLSLGSELSHAKPKFQNDHYALVEGQKKSSLGCVFDYRIFEPKAPISSTLVILGHGFLRNQNRLIDLSKALANSGIRTVTMDYCNMRPWNGNHQANAQDMRGLATALGNEQNVIYGGFSAGALAAVLAADESTKAVFILDFVDQADLGKAALSALQIPLIGMHGPPSACNANSQAQNAVENYLQDRAKRTGVYQLISDASHCEFESPSNWLCRAACADDDPESDNQRTRQLIIDRSVEMLKPYLDAPAA